MVSTYKEKYLGKVLLGKLLLDKQKEFHDKVWNLEGLDVEITIDVRQKNRSVNYNKYYWKVIIEKLCEATGGTPDSVHDGLKKKYLPQIIRFNEKKNRREILTSTRDLSNREFAKYCELIRVGESDICIIPAPNEVDYD